MNRFRADLLLLLAAFIWGTAFIAQKDANRSMGPILFVGLRFVLSTAALLPLMRREARRVAAPLTRLDWIQAVIIGFCLFAGACLQQAGLITTTATNGGFLTALYVVFVPFILWLLTRQAPRTPVVFACLISAGGAWLLADNGQARHWAIGDLLVVLSDLAWALAIVLIGVFLQRTHRPFFLSFVQYAVTAVLGLSAGLALEPVSLAGIVATLPPLLYAGLLSGALAFTVQIIAQKHTPPSEAALIMSLESVFAAVAGAWLLGERLLPLGIAGAALILLGVMVVEVGPRLMRSLRT